MKIPKNILAKLYIYYVYKRYAIEGFLSLNFNKFIYKKLLKIGKNPKLWGSIVIKIVGNGSIVIGDHIHLVSDPKRSFISLYSIYIFLLNFIYSKTSNSSSNNFKPF